MSCLRDLRRMKEGGIDGGGNEVCIVLNIVIADENSAITQVKIVMGRGKSR